MKQSIIWIIIVLLVLAGLGWWWYSSTITNTPPAVVPEVAGEDAFIDGSKDSAPAMSAYTVRYTESGFSPTRITVPVGTTVTFVNQGATEMWVASDEHPTHTQYDGTSKDEHCVDGVVNTTAFDQCGVSSTYSFTFMKAGTFGFHNHRESDHHGMVVVE